MFVISKQPEQTQIASFLKKWKWECSPSSEYKRHFMPSQKPHDFSFFLKLTVHWLPNQSSISKCKHSLMKFWLIWSAAKLDLWWEVYSRDDKTCSTNKCWFRFLQIWVTTWLALWHNGGRIASICIFHHSPLISPFLAFWLFVRIEGCCIRKPLKLADIIICQQSFRALSTGIQIPFQWGYLRW